MMSDLAFAALAAVVAASLALVVYAYVGYPASLLLLARVFGRLRKPPCVPDDELPSVSLVICALNEEKWIAQRVANALAQDYPTGRLKIVVASDGSTDRTARLVGALAHKHPQRVALHEFTARTGKANVLNRLLPELDTQLIVLSDANTFFERSAVRNLARWFTHPGVLAVCGKLELTDPATGSNVDSLYWRFENLLKQQENRLGALLGANGAIYAIRRSQFVPIPPDTIIDDFVLPLGMKLRYGGDIIYDEQAVATEETPPQVRDEFKRRARIGAGGFQALVSLWPLLLPGSGWTSWAFVSHKLLRWIAPLLLVAALVANALLLADPAFRALFALQVVFYAIALLGAFMPGSGLVPRCLRLATLFTSMNAALAVGFFRWLLGAQRGTWQRTAR